MVSVRLSACFVLINFLQKTVFPPCLPTFLCVSMFGVGKFRADCTLLVCPFLFGGIIGHENELVRFFFLFDVNGSEKYHRLRRNYR